jgi:hypothetical protein
MCVSARRNSAATLRLSLRNATWQSWAARAASPALNCASASWMSRSPAPHMRSPHFGGGSRGHRTGPYGMAENASQPTLFPRRSLHGPSFRCGQPAVGGMMPRRIRLGNGGAMPPSKATEADFLGRLREIVSDPLNLLIERVPTAGIVEGNEVVLHNGNRVPKPAPKWAAPTPSPLPTASTTPKSHNHCAAVLSRLRRPSQRIEAVIPCLH